MTSTHTLSRFLVVAIVFVTSFTAAHSQISSNVEFLGQMNNYSATGYNDCWGYTAPDGREYALLGVRNGTSVIDITDAPTLREVAFIPSVFSPWKDIKTYMHYAYVVTDSQGEGIQIIDLSALPDTATLVTTFVGSSLISHNISIDTQNGILYAQGGPKSIRVVSLADPENLVEIDATFQGLGPNHDVLVENNRLYISEGSSHTIGIYDVSDPASPVLLVRFGIPEGGYVHNAWPTADGTLLMTTEETEGKFVKLWNISNLQEITPTGTYLAQENLAHNTHVKGDYAYISHYKDGLRIVDISNPFQPAEVAHYDTYNMSLSGIYHGAWGAFPFFDSGKILISDMESGLFVVYFAGSKVVSVETPEENTALPASFSLHQNYPNPFNPTTTIRFDLPNESPVTLRVFDMLGQEVRVLRQGTLRAGSHSVYFDARGLASGMYVYRLETPGFVQARRLVVMK